MKRDKDSGTRYYEIALPGEDHDGEEVELRDVLTAQRHPPRFDPDRDWRAGEPPMTPERRRAILSQLGSHINGARDENFQAYLRAQSSAEARELADASATPERRAQSEGTNSQGGFLVPETFSARFVENLKGYDRLFDKATTLETETGGACPIPLDDDSAHVATLVAESGTSVQNVDAVFDSIAFGKCPTWRSGLVRVPIELVQDSGYDLSTLLAGIFARRFARGCGAAFVTTLLAAADVAVTTASPTVILPEEMLDLMGSLDSGFGPNGSFLMSWAAYCTLIKSKSSGTGNFMLNEHYFFPMSDSDLTPILLGRPVVLCPSMPAQTAGLKPVAFGDISRFIVRRVRGGPTLRVYPERYAEYGQVGFEAYLRIQSALAKPSNGPVPIRVLQMHA
jgi:HK97 family phage major capsid protein